MFKLLYIFSQFWLEKARSFQRPWDEEKEPNKDTIGVNIISFFSLQWHCQLKNYFLMGIIWINLLNKYWWFRMHSKIWSILHTFVMWRPTSGATEIWDFQEVPHFRMSLDLSISLQGTGNTRNPTGKHFPDGKSIMASRAEGPERHLNTSTLLPATLSIFWISSLCIWTTSCYSKIVSNHQFTEPETFPRE